MCEDVQDLITCSDHNSAAPKGDARPSGVWRSAEQTVGDEEARQATCL